MTTTPSSDRSRVEANLEGRVQGVGFRFFTRQRATQLGLTGWVHNDDDGSVTVVAEGERSQLEEFVEAIEDGPPTAVVEHVDIDWQEAEDSFDSFTVRR